MNFQPQQSDLLGIYGRFLACISLRSFSGGSRAPLLELQHWKVL